MPEVADAFRRFGSSYEEVHGAAMLPSHRRAIADIIACRTEALGGQQWCCNHCGALLHVFHSCRNRACPNCHAEQTRAWLQQRREEILPVPLTRRLAGSHHRLAGRANSLGVARDLLCLEHLNRTCASAGWPQRMPSRKSRLLSASTGTAKRCGGSCDRRNIMIDHETFTWF